MRATDDILRQWLSEADGLLVTAGAGMGIDSGLPDFRGAQGFWKAYPALGRARIDFTQIANPLAFAQQARTAWGFYGHRLQTYRGTQPHPGFAQLLEIGEHLPRGVQVFTSNVDGQFQKAGYPVDRICEIHGSIHHLQCSAGCNNAIWPAENFQPEIDAEHGQLISPLPTCPCCGALARPNILMFGDWQWIEWRTATQQRELENWLSTVQRPLCVEIGAGTHIPTVRYFSEQNAWRLIRINPDEAQVSRQKTAIGLAMGGQAGIAKLHALWQSTR
ncbi:MAG: NAD-dependent deacetylase [Rhodocyclales bacterium]|nr:NAD-dependent deacetylase [Rhodocyclales bacterium]